MPIASKLDGYARALLTYCPKNDRASTMPLRELGLTRRYAFGSR
jgi:hypothetical protein